MQIGGHVCVDFYCFFLLFWDRTRRPPRSLFTSNMARVHRRGLFKNTVKHNIKQGFSHCAWCVQERVRLPRFWHFRHRHDLCESVLFCIVLGILWGAFYSLRTNVLWLPKSAACQALISVPFWMDFGCIWLAFGTGAWGDAVRLRRLEPSWKRLDTVTPFWSRLEASWAALETSWRRLGGSKIDQKSILEGYSIGSSNFARIAVHRVKGDLSFLKDFGCPRLSKWSQIWFKIHTKIWHQIKTVLSTLTDRFLRENWDQNQAHFQ